jgi:hypothetical protein
MSPNLDTRSSTLTLDDLKDLPPLRCESVSVLGKEMWLAELTAWERDERIEVAFSEYKKAHFQEHNAGIKAFIVAACWCKSEARDFVAEDSREIAAAASKLMLLGTPFIRLMEKAEKLNALSDDEVKQIEKN